MTAASVSAIALQASPEVAWKPPWRFSPDPLLATHREGLAALVRPHRARSPPPSTHLLYPS